MLQYYRFICKAHAYVTRQALILWGICIENIPGIYDILVMLGSDIVYYIAEPRETACNATGRNTNQSIEVFSWCQNIPFFTVFCFGYSVVSRSLGRLGQDLRDFHWQITDGMGSNLGKTSFTLAQIIFVKEYVWLKNIQPNNKENISITW